MSRVLKALRRAEAARSDARSSVVDDRWHNKRDFRVVTVASNKGGVGKTTVAANLAAYFRAMREDDPVLVFGFDDQTMLDRIFEISPETASSDLAEALAQGTLSRVARFGQYGVEYVPSSRDVPELRRLLGGPSHLQRILLDSGRSGFIVIDTKSDFENLTQAAIVISDLTIVVVKDQTSFYEARRVFDLIERCGRPRESARILLSLMDLRVKYRDGESVDVMGHLISEVRREGYPLFQSFLSRSPKVESLYTNPEARAYSILHAANQSVVHRQMQRLSEEVLEILARRPMVEARGVLR